MGGSLYACRPCGRHHYAHHSCNHRACPLCGRLNAARWVQRELARRVGAPYFMVTFTLPQELRPLFLGPEAKEAFDLFFRAAAGALQEKLAEARGFPAKVSGFVAVLHTWNQRLLFHPHIHMIVPGAGLDAEGRVITVPKANFLVPKDKLRGAFRDHFRKGIEKREWPVPEKVWKRKWGVNLKAVGTGQAAVKYLGGYVTRTAIGDSRIVRADDQTVTFTWKDRARGNRVERMTLTGEEFLARYLRHVLPRGLRSIRFYGFCHPSAKRNRERIRLHTGLPVDLGAATPPPPQPDTAPCCPQCRQPMQWIARLEPWDVPAQQPRPPPKAPLVAACA